MTKTNEANPSARFPGFWLPWLLTLVMLGVYLATLQPWLTGDNRYAVSNLAGWNWRPNIFIPLTSFVTAPLGWLPSRWIPLGLNFFCAVCGALTLGLLARSVALLPHDRTQEERDRQPGLSGVLTIPQAWLPPAFAVLVCGLSYFFWRQSTSGSGPVVDVLVFAYLVRCLLEFRIDGRESWMSIFAFGYGVAIADDWLFALLFPAVLTAVIWIKGVTFFNWRFLLRMILLGLAGLSILLLPPLLSSFHHDNPLPFKSSVVYLFGLYKANLTALPRGVLAGLCLTSLLPVAVLSVRWSPFSGDTSKLGAFLAQSMVHVVHGFMLLLCLWTAFDPKFSPRELVPGLRSLPLYYLGALGIGYFAGYFLLVFGTKPMKRRHEPPFVLQLAKSAVVAGVWLLFLVAPLLLVVKNFPLLSHAGNRDWQHYGESLDKSLPPAGSVVLSDDPSRLFFLQAWLERTGKAADYLLLDTSLLREYPAYFTFVDHQRPAFKLSSYLAGTPLAQVVNPETQINLFRNMTREREVDYLHPTFGYFMEALYQHPRGLFYPLTSYEVGVLQRPPLSEAEIAVNERFWKSEETDVLTPLSRKLTPPKKKTAERNFLDRFFKSIHASENSNPEAQEVGLNYSRALDYWGAQLQVREKLPAAAHAFELALSVNPENVAAKINLAFNARLQAGGRAENKSIRQLQEDFGTKRTWDEILGLDGPFDEPNFCFHLGMVYIQFGNNKERYRWLVRQAITELDRARILAPEQTSPRLWLAQLYDLFQQPSNELAVASEVLAIAPHDPSALYLQANAMIQLKQFDRAIPSLTELLAVQTNDVNIHLNRAISYLGIGNLPAAQADYEAVAAVESYENRFRAFYGLGEIAYRNKNHPEAIKQWQAYLKSAPTNTDEFKLITDRVKEMQNSGGK